MRITPDANVLLRFLVRDDLAQFEAAAAALEEAETIVLTLPALCEVAWVLSRGYRTPRRAIAEGLRVLLNMQGVEAEDGVVEAGLAQLDAGGDFADGVIAAAGALAGGDVFVTFDRKAVRILQERSYRTRLLEAPPQP